MTALYELTIAGARALLDKGEITPAERTQAYLDRTGAVENHVRAVLAMDDEHPIEQAKAADQPLGSLRRGAAGPAPAHPRARSPRPGLPQAIKDVISAAVLTATGG